MAPPQAMLENANNPSFVQANERQSDNIRTMEILDILRVADSLVLDYKQSIKNIKYRRTGIRFSEGFLLHILCRIYNVDLVIESGVNYGMSTRILVNCGMSIISLDRKPVCKEIADVFENNPNAKFVMGESPKTLPEILDDVKYKNKKIGVFIDGPKRLLARQLAEKAFSYDNVFFVGIHDQEKRRDNYRMSQSFKNVIYSDHPEFVKKYSSLDRDIVIMLDAELEAATCHTDEYKQHLKSTGWPSAGVAGFVGKS